MKYIKTYEESSIYEDGDIVVIDNKKINNKGLSLRAKEFINTLSPIQILHIKKVSDRT